MAIRLCECWEHRTLTHWGGHKIYRHFPDDIFKRIFLDENVCIWLKISLNFVPKVLNNNIPVLVQIMVWPREKPLFEPMMVSLLAHICVTWPQWVNRRYLLYFGLCQSIGITFVIICVNAALYPIEFHVVSWPTFPVFDSNRQSNTPEAYVSDFIIKWHNTNGITTPHIYINWEAGI